MQRRLRRAMAFARAPMLWKKAGAERVSRLQEPILRHSEDFCGIREAAADSYR